MSSKRLSFVPRLLSPSSLENDEEEKDTSSSPPKRTTSSPSSKRKISFPRTLSTIVSSGKRKSILFGKKSSSLPLPLSKPPPDIEEEEEENRKKGRKERSDSVMAIMNFFGDHYEIQRELKDSGNFEIYSFYRLVDNSRLTFGEVTNLLASELEGEHFRNRLLGLFNDLHRYSSIFWECRPVYSQDDPFEFSICTADITPLRIARQNSKPFQKELEDGFRRGELAVSFPNLSGETTLVVPVGINESVCDGYAHLLLFMKSKCISLEQKHKFWIKVGQELKLYFAMNHFPIYLSTSGLRVSWLHVRIEDFPKHYRYSGYK